MQSYDNDISRYMIEYISDLLGINFEPQSFEIYQNFPNPFNPVTKINFDIDLSSSVKLNIYNVRGQLVYEHNFGNLNSGFYSYDFDGSNLTSGVYMYNISTSKRVSPYKQMILVK